MKIEEIIHRAERLKVSFEQAFDDGVFDFDKAGSELNSIMADLVLLKSGTATESSPCENGSDNAPARKLDSKFPSGRRAVIFAENFR